MTRSTERSRRGARASGFALFVGFGAWVGPAVVSIGGFGCSQKADSSPTGLVSETKTSAVLSADPAAASGAAMDPSNRRASSSAMALAPGSAVAPGDSAAAGDKTFDCGKRGQKMCPMQAWMKTTMAEASSSGDKAKLASALTYVATHVPPGMPDWVKMAKEGAEKAKAGDIDGAKRSCKTCHDAYKDQFKRTMRDMPY